GHAAGARSRPQARQPGAAGRCRQRDDECLPRSGHRSSRFRHRTRRLSPPGRADMTSKAEMFGAALAKAVKKTAASLTDAKPGAMYRTNLPGVPQEAGLQRDNGWVDMQVQFLIDKQSGVGRSRVGAG